MLAGLVAAGVITWFGALAVSGVRPRDLLRPADGSTTPAV